MGIRTFTLTRFSIIAPLLSVSLLSPASGPSCGSAAFTIGMRGVAVQAVNLRSRPEIPQIWSANWNGAVLQKGEKVTVIEEPVFTDGYWLKIRRGSGEEGWVKECTPQNGILVAPEATATPSAPSGLIVFDTQRHGYGNGEIYIMNADGSAQTRLTRNSADDFQAAWSPDGSQIAFVSDRDGNYEIYMMSADGSNQRRLTNNSADDVNPAWSPDGKQITFSSNRDGNYEVYVMNVDGSAQTRLTNNEFNDYVPKWSPDGKRIVSFSDRVGGEDNFDIYVMNADGSAQTRLTGNTADEFEAAWSPNGKTIVFVSARDGNNEIYVMNADGSQTRLTRNSASDRTPAWSPNGSWIVFVSERDGNAEIYIMRADGSEQTRLTNDPASDLFPDW